MSAVRLIDLVAKGGLVVPLLAKDRRGALSRLVEGLGLPAGEEEAVVDALELREAQASTLICPGLAFPHARLGDFSEFYLAFGVAKADIPFGSGNARVVMLLLTSPEKNKLVLQTRAAFARALAADAGLLGRLMVARSLAEVETLLEPIEVEVDRPLCVRDIMLPDAHAVLTSESIRGVLGKLREQDLTELAVVDGDGRLLGSIGIDEITGLGIPEYFDLIGDLSFVHEYQPFSEVFRREHSETIAELYCREVSTVSPDAHVVWLAQLFRKNRVRYVYVVENGRLLGTCTRRQLLKRVLLP